MVILLEPLTIFLCETTYIGVNTQHTYAVYGNRIQKSVIGIENPPRIRYTDMHMLRII